MKRVGEVVGGGGWGVGGVVNASILTFSTTAARSVSKHSAVPLLLQNRTEYNG